MLGGLEMSKIIVMPKLGLTMKKGKIFKWHKKEGDQVKNGEVIFQVETDKLTNDVVADEDGVIRKIFVPEGENVPVAHPVAIIAKASEDISDLLSNVLDHVESEQVDIKKTIDKKEDVTIKQKGDYIRATPYAKKLAKEQSIDLKDVPGSGHEGLVIAKDILGYKDKEKIKISPTAAKMANEYGVDIKEVVADGRIMKADILGALEHVPYDEEGKTRIIEPSNIRKIIAARMHESWTISPRVTYNLEIDVKNFKDLRDNLKESFIKLGTKLTYNHILMKILAKALLEYPYLNGSFDGENIILHDYVNIGLAIDVSDGLLVPNIKNIQAKSLLELAVETEKIIEKARKGTLSPDYLEGGTFTLTNMGMFGLDSFSPIINQPEVAILGVNRIVDKAVVVNGDIVVRPMMNLSLTADHRLVDGAMAARFLARIKEFIENPYLLIV